MRASNVKELVLPAPMNPSNVKPLTGVPCGLFYSFYSAAIQISEKCGAEAEATPIPPILVLISRCDHY